MAEEEVIEIDIAQLKKMKVQELRKQAAELELETKGTKAELLARIEKYLKEQEEEDLLEEEEGEGEEGETEEGEEEEKTVEVKKVEQPPSEQVVPPLSETQSADVSKEIANAVPLTGVGVLTAEEKLARRAERFGANTSDEAKKIARAKRFGVSSENGMGAQRVPTGEELERMKKRAERFGLNVAPSLTRVEEDEKRLKRKERFGLTATDLSLEERKKARMERFGTTT